jgi:hypothetical protein
MQLHINADIAWGFQQYLAATGDFDLFLAGGADVVLSSALVWLHWGTWDKGKFHLRYVTGPDEYNVLVNDNCFTNLMAANHLRFAVQLAQLIATRSQTLWEELCNRIDLDPVGDVADMERAAERMYLPFDPEHQIHLQDDAFLRKKPWTFGNLPGVDSRLRPTAVLSEKYHPLTIYRHRVCKQADVLLAQSLLGDCFSVDAKRANFRYYENLTTHDSSLTTSTFSIIASGLGQGAKAFEYFRRTACVDIENIVGNTSEGLHMAAMAGSWSCVVRGFAGLQYDSFELASATIPTLHFDPYVPERWNEYSFSVAVRGALLHVRVTRTFAHYTLASTPETKFSAPAVVVVRHGPDRRIRLALDTGATSAPLHRTSSVPIFDTVVFDIASLVAHVEDDHYSAWKQVLDPILQENQRELFSHGSGMFPPNTGSSQGHQQQQHGSSVGLSPEMGLPGVTVGGSSLNAGTVTTFGGGSLHDAGPTAMVPNTPASGFTREQYYAYIRYHPVVGNRKFGGLQRLFASVGLAQIPYGEPADPASVLSICGLANRKKLAFREVVKASGGVRSADGIDALLRELKSQKVHVGCASASRNAKWLLEEAGLAHLVDHVVDGDATADGDEWRDGALIQKCAQVLGGAAFERCIVIVDSIAGLSRTALVGGVNNRTGYGLVCCTNGDGEAGDIGVAKQYGVDVLSGPMASVSVEDLQRWMITKAKPPGVASPNTSDAMGAPAPSATSANSSPPSAARQGAAVAPVNHARVPSNLST